MTFSDILEVSVVKDPNADPVIIGFYFEKGLKKGDVVKHFREKIADLRKKWVYGMGQFLRLAEKY